MVPGKVGYNSCKIGGLDILKDENAGIDGIEVYERLDDPLGSPTITIHAVDSGDVINKNKINGGEDLDVEISWQDEEGGTCKFTGKLHSAQLLDGMESRNQGSGHSKKWSAMSVQPELIKSQRFPVEETMSEQTTKTMEKILKDYAKTEKQIEVNAPSEKRDLVFSRDHPVDALQKSMQESSSTQDPTSAYAIFQKFENGKPKIVIDTIKRLSEQSPVATLKYDTTKRDTPTKDTIINLITDSAFDSLPRATSRAIKKSWNAGTHTVVDEKDPKSDEGKTKTPAYNKEYSDGTYDVPYLEDVTNNSKKHTTADACKRRANFMGHASQGCATVEIAGNPKITVGSVVKLDIPARTDDGSFSPDGTVNQEVLVTAIRHKIRPDGSGDPQWTMVCECSKLGMQNGGGSA